ncbi:MAG TPA: hypothetical protein VGE74_25760 [Gemmata sp.]
MEPSSIAALVTSLLAAGVATWTALRKQRVTESADDDERWKGYAKERQKQHNADVARLERRIEQQAQRIEQQAQQLDEVRALESRCRVDMAEVKAENRALREEVTELKRDLAECWVRARRGQPGTGDHEPLKDPTP